MDIINRNLIIASHLYRASAFLSVFAYFMFQPRPGLLAEFFGLAFIILIAHLVRKGFNWVRWVLLVITIIFIPFLVIILWDLFKENVFFGFTSLGINLLQILAVVYLFLPYKQPDLDETNDQISSTQPS